MSVVDPESGGSLFIRNVRIKTGPQHGLKVQNHVLIREEQIYLYVFMCVRSVDSPNSFRVLNLKTAVIN